MTKIALPKRSHVLKCLIIFLSLITVPLRGSHLLGGQIHYRMTAPGTYEITAEMYRDCACSNCASFDYLANFGVYRCNSDDNCPGQTQANPFMRVTVTLQSTEFITRHPDSSCEPFAGNCYEKGIYRATLNLPVSNMSYFIVFQRCCYGVYSNLENPFDTGITISTKITPEAQQVAGNESPRLIGSPLVELCAGQPFSVDLAWIDPNDHILSYALCAPLNGGGPFLSQFEYSTCTGAYPNPGCPPPFMPVNFSSPYSPEQPFAANGSLAINTATGVLTGMPDLIGRYLAAICVTETHEGVEVGRHWIQFSVNILPGTTSTSGHSPVFDHFDIAPNPTHRTLAVRPKNLNTPYRLVVFDLSGRSVFQSAYQLGTVEITPPAAGIYILDIEQAGVRMRQRVVILSN